MPAAQFRHGIIPDVLLLDLTRYHDDRGWLSELFRADELPPALRPAMGYLSMTEAGVLRGPHEHRWQTDYFCFLGPSTFQLFLWDNRSDSATYGIYQEVRLAKPRSVVIPPGVVHGYRNVGRRPSLVLNFPNQLYRGEGKKQVVDEIRHEDDPFSPFKVAPLRRRPVRSASRRS